MIKKETTKIGYTGYGIYVTKGGINCFVNSTLSTLTDSYTPILSIFFRKKENLLCYSSKKIDLYL